MRLVWGGRHNPASELDSAVASLLTLVPPFGLQGQQIVAWPMAILPLAVPILVQAHLTAGLAYKAPDRLTGVKIARSPYAVASPTMTDDSELTVSRMALSSFLYAPSSHPASKRLLRSAWTHGIPPFG